MSTELAENQDLGPLGYPHHRGVLGFCRTFHANLKIAQELRASGMLGVRVKLLLPKVKAIHGDADTYSRCPFGICRRPLLKGVTAVVALARKEIAAAAVGGSENATDADAAYVVSLSCLADTARGIATQPMRLQVNPMLSLIE